MILADCISGHFGGLHYAQQAKPTGKRIRRHLPVTGPHRGAEMHQRTSQRVCSAVGCTRRADSYADTCIQHDRGLP